VKHVNQVLKALTEVKLTVAKDKFVFCATAIPVLGMTGEYEELDFEIPSQQVEQQDQMVIEDEEQEVIESSNDVVPNQRARAKRATRVNDRVREGMNQLVGVDDLSDDS